MSGEFAFTEVSTREDWDRWSKRNVVVTDDGVTLATVPTVTATGLCDPPVDVDSFRSGDLCLLEDSGDVAVYDVDEDRLVSLSFHEYALTDPVSICATVDDVYVLDGETGRLSAFTRRTRRRRWTSEPLEDPVAIVGSGRTVLVLDRSSDGGGALVSVSTDRRRTVATDPLGTPVALAADDDLNVYVLDDRDGRRRLHWFEAAGTDVVSGTPVTVDLSDVGFPEDGFTPTAVATASPGEVLLGGETTGDDVPSLYRYRFDDGRLVELPGFDRACTSLLGVASGRDDGSIWYAVTDELCQLLETPRNRKDPDSTRYEGEILGRFDSGDGGTQWHRVTFDVQQPRAGTHVDLDYFATSETGPEITAIDGLDRDGIEALRSVDVEDVWSFAALEPTHVAEVVPGATHERASRWLEDAHDVLRVQFEEEATATRRNDPDDVLLESATGRYLVVAVSFVGNRRTAPLLGRLRAYCPRQSYLRHLPSIYRQNDGDAAFLERFLSIFETVFVDVEEELDDLTHYFDPHEVPAEYLSWLNEWLAVGVGETWPESARRELLARAPELYQKRGTREGLREMLDLYFSHVSLPAPSAERPLELTERSLSELVSQGYLTEREATVERERLRDALTDRDEVRQRGAAIVEYADLEVIDHAELEKAYADLLGHPHRFLVLVDPDLPDEHAREVERIVESEKPAHTVASTVSLRSRMQLGENTYLGINSMLPKRRYEIGHSALGQETTLPET